MRRWHHGIAIGELGLAQLLLVVAALLVVSFVNATHVNLGFETEGRVAAEINLTGQYVRQIGDSGRIDPAKKIRFIEQVIDHVSREHGVRAVGAGFFPPLGDPPSRGVQIEGEPELPPNQQPIAIFQIVTPGYFRASGMTMTAGRSFLDTDRADSTGAPGATIINEAFARQYFAGRNPIGRVLTFNNGTRRHEIVGIVADARLGSVERPADPAFYVPLRQNDERWGSVAFIAWSDAGAAAAQLLVSAIHAADPQQPISRVRTFDEILSRSLAPRRFNTWLVGLFAATALLLAAIGTYGVMAFAVASRTRELGLRAALGAAPGDLSRMVLGQGLALTAGASVIGLAAATITTRFMASLLFGVAPRDPWTFAGVAILLSLVALAATVVPAWRAMRIDPMVALRD